MVLVDTSVWVEHLRAGMAELETLLLNGEVLCHSFVIGELACGNLKNRGEILALLGELPRATPADDEEVLLCIERYHLMGKGLGLVDVHLAASALMTGASLWSLDKRLAEAASQLGLLPE